MVIECTKETVPFVHGLGSTTILPKNGFFASKSKQSARRSGEDESVSDKRQRSPLPPHFVLAQNHSKKCGGNSDGRNDSYTERLLTARKGPPARSKISWDSPLHRLYHVQTVPLLQKPSADCSLSRCCAKLLRITLSIRPIRHPAEFRFVRADLPLPDDRTAPLLSQGSG
jgi:hypothetical protein